MEFVGLSLKESEQSFFQELFSYYDKENSGKIQGLSIAEFFRSSQLSTDKLDSIAELCGAKRLGHFGRSQFYIALKLVAAAQNGLPLTPETFSSGLEIPLPRFQDNNATSEMIDSNGVLQLVENNIKVAAAAQKTVSHQIQYQGLAETDSQNSNSPMLSPKGGDRNCWTHFTHDQIESDHDHLLGDESSERHSSDDENEIWTINEEQNTYYMEQFAKMQPDIRLKIGGGVAKDFFEKSKLPVAELSKIWQLSDIDKDGALSLAEFCTAMHLVVLRRNNISLPEKLPPSLIPKINSSEFKKLSSPPPPVVPNTTTTTATSNAEEPLISPQNKEWTKFQQSPTSTVSSPGAKPVNFDFSAASVEQDPQIFHPVAVRLTPDFQPAVAAIEHEELLQEFPTIAHALGPKKEPPPPPPPRPRRNHTRSSSLDLNRMGKEGPPAVPPRVSPSSAGAFEVYRKPTASSLSLDLDMSNLLITETRLDENVFTVNTSTASTTITNTAAGFRSISNESAEKKRYSSAPSVTMPAPIAVPSDVLHEKLELQVTIGMHKEKNSQLVRLNTELDQELSEIMAERIALEIQLEHMKNASS